MQKYSFPESERRRKIGKAVGKVKTFHLNHQTIILMLLSFIFTYYLVKTGLVDTAVSFLGTFGYLSAFILGFLFSFGFTTTPAAITLFFLARHINPVGMALVAAIGGSLSNLIVYNFVKYSLMNEIRQIFAHDFRIEVARYEILLTQRVLNKKWVKIIVPALAGILTAIPVPTELMAVVLWNIIGYRLKTVVIYSFIFNFIGILVLGLFGAGV